MNIYIWKEGQRDSSIVSIGKGTCPPILSTRVRSLEGQNQPSQVVLWPPNCAQGDFLPHDLYSEIPTILAESSWLSHVCEDSEGQVGRGSKRERMPWKINAKAYRKHPSKGCQHCLPSQSLLWKIWSWALICSSFIAIEKNTNMLSTLLYEKQPQNALPNTIICMHYLTGGSPDQKFRNTLVLWFWYRASWYSNQNVTRDAIIPRLDWDQGTCLQGGSCSRLLARGLGFSLTQTVHLCLNVHRWKEASPRTKSTREHKGESQKPSCPCCPSNTSWAISFLR